MNFTESLIVVAVIFFVPLLAQFLGGSVRAVTFTALFFNLIGAAAFMYFAFHVLTIQADQARNWSIEPDPLGWAFSAMPIMASFFLLNIAWMAAAYVLKVSKGRWMFSKLFWLGAPVWIVAYFVVRQRLESVSAYFGW